MIRVVTAYTPDYAERARRCEASVLSHGLPFTGVPFKSRGSWLKNIHYKPTAIKRVLEDTHDNCLWLDADCTMKFPPFIPDNIDFACRHCENYADATQEDHRTFDWDKLKWTPHNWNRVYRIITGTRMYFAYNDRVLSLVSEWESLSAKYGYCTSDELTLMRALEFRPDIVQGLLPAGFAPTDGVRCKAKPKGWL